MGNPGLLGGRPVRRIHSQRVCEEYYKAYLGPKNMGRLIPIPMAIPDKGPKPSLKRMGDKYVDGNSMEYLLWELAEERKRIYASLSWRYKFLLWLKRIL